MTDANRRAAIGDEAAAGDEALHAMRELARLDQRKSAMNRAYYAAFHYALACILATTGTEVASHRGVDVLLRRDLVRAGKLDPDVASLLPKLQTQRNLADYGRFFDPTEASLREQVADAERFVAAARALLVAEGWLPA